MRKFPDVTDEQCILHLSVLKDECTTVNPCMMGSREGVYAL
mgnify:CR=1 FL=1